MKLFQNPFVRFCTSGLGTGTDAGKAVGYALLICAIPIVVLVYAISFFLKIKKKRENRQTDV